MMHRFGEGVEPLRPVQRDDAVARLPLDQNRLFVHRRLFDGRFNPIAMASEKRREAPTIATSRLPRGAWLRARSRVRPAEFREMRSATRATPPPSMRGELRDPIHHGLGLTGVSGSAGSAVIDMTILLLGPGGLIILGPIGNRIIKARPVDGRAVSGSQSVQVAIPAAELEFHAALPENSAASCRRRQRARALPGAEAGGGRTVRNARPCAAARRDGRNRRPVRPRSPGSCRHA